MSCSLALVDSLFQFKASPQKPIINNRNIAVQFSSLGICNQNGGSFVGKGLRHQSHLLPMRKHTVIQAVAVPVAASALESDEYRRELAEKYGFEKIGEPLPDNVTLKDVLNSLPKKVFEIDEMKSWKTVLISVTSYALGLFLISKSPWYLLPFAWAWTGTGATGVSSISILSLYQFLTYFSYSLFFLAIQLFVVAHDCAHKSFSKNKLVEDIVGNVALMPLIYPYEAWRFKHDQHHAKTNMLQEDIAWHPIWKEDFDSSSLLRKAIIYGYGPFRPLMSIVHWLMWHFDLKKFRSNEVKRVMISLACVYSFMAIAWPLIIYKTGIMGWINYWLMPWLGYHFWMSTFTMVHHSAPHIPFKDSDEWNAAQAQLNGTVHCNYPRWVEILCHDINVHIPHHISPKIPSYNLRAAHKSLQENWGKYLNEATWNWRLMKTILTMCHVYDKEKNYVAFDELAPEDSSPITFLRKAMPNFA
ncbi:putative acyl-CoA (9+3)-desaturase [Lupinus albus]|uniref:Putative acyl-CoA (9+3)-desaturase n=1 Tax=Lupinus albus TaxID=3870 RepID=A0A6A4Q3H6_LUPAL|nr:putative acyl-CoA (9+3)-desaturase [Lupinus albus]